MSQSVAGLDVTYAAEGTGIKQHYLVIHGTSKQQAKVGGSAGEIVIGYNQTAPGLGLTEVAAGRAMAVRLVGSGGSSKAVASEAITKGAKVQSTGDGRIKPATADNEFVCGHAAEAAANANEVIEVELVAYTASVA